MHKRVPIAVSAILLSAIAVSPAVAGAGKKAVAVIPSVIPPPAAARASVAGGSAAVRLDSVRGRHLVTASYPSNHLQRGLLFQQQGKADFALIEFLKAAQENPLQPRAYYEQAVIFKQKGYNKLAISALTQALAVRPSYRDARVLLASLYLQNGDVSQAAQELFKSLGLNASGAAAPPPSAPDRTLERLQSAAMHLPSIVQTPHGRLNSGNASPGTSPPSGYDAFAERDGSSEPPVPGSAAKLASHVAVPVGAMVVNGSQAAPAQPAARPAAGERPATVSDDELLKEILGIDPAAVAAAPAPQAVAGGQSASPRAAPPVPAAASATTPGSGTAGGAERPPIGIVENKDGKTIVSASGKEAGQLLKQVKKEGGAPAFNLLNPLGWLGWHKTPQAAPVQPQTAAPASQPRYVEEIKRRAEKAAKQKQRARKSRVAAWFDHFLDSGESKAVAASKAEEDAPMSTIVHADAGDNDFNPLLAIARPVPIARSRQPLLQPQPCPPVPADNVDRLPPAPRMQAAATMPPAPPPARAQTPPGAGWTLPQLALQSQRMIRGLVAPGASDVGQQSTARAAASAAAAAAPMPAAGGVFNLLSALPGHLLHGFHQLFTPPRPVAIALPGSVGGQAIPPLQTIASHGPQSTPQVAPISFYVRTSGAKTASAPGNSLALPVSGRSEDEQLPVPPITESSPAAVNGLLAQAPLVAPIELPPRPQALVRQPGEVPVPAVPVVNYTGSAAFAPPPVPRPAANIAGSAGSGVPLPGPPPAATTTTAFAALPPTAGGNSGHTNGLLLAQLPSVQPASVPTRLPASTPSFSSAPAAPMPGAPPQSTALNSWNQTAAALSAPAHSPAAGAAPAAVAPLLSNTRAATAMTGQRAQPYAAPPVGTGRAPLPGGADAQPATPLAATAQRYIWPIPVQHIGRPNLTAQQEHFLDTMHSVDAPRARLPAATARAQPPEDEWSRRMKYLLEHGTASLRPGEAFMFSEETGEGTIFLRDGASVKRKIAEARDHEEVARLRRPDILNAEGQLQYSLSLLGKIIKPGNAKPAPVPMPSAPPTAHSGPASTLTGVNDLLGKSSQGFLGWLKSIVPF